MYSDSVYNGLFSFFMPNYVNKDKGIISKKSLTKVQMVLKELLQKEYVEYKPNNVIEDLKGGNGSF